MDEIGSKGETPTAVVSAGARSDVEDLDTQQGPGLDSKILLARARSRLLGQRAAPITIGRYEVVDRVGSGGMGVVYAARDPHLDRKIAIKVLRSELDEGSCGRSRLIREAQALAKLSHQNVVHVYEVGEHDEQLYLAMEFVEGRTLREWLRETTRSASEILAMFIAAGRGLLAAHHAGVVHRDFKPDNVLVGKDERPRVMDFGLARPTFDIEDLPSQDVLVSGDQWSIPTAENDEVARMTVTGTVLGTPAYMDPQQLMGKVADAASDQYAFCVSLFEGLYGERPYQGSTVTELVRHMDGRIPVRADIRGRGVPGRIHRALMRGLQFDRERRHESFDALLEELEHALAIRNRRRALPWVVAAGSLGIAAAVFATRGGLHPAEPTAATASEDPRAEIVANTDLPEPLPDALPDDPAKVTIHRLDNGLTVYVAPRADEPKVAVRMVVRAGSANEPDHARGIAELTRHAIDAGGPRFGVLDAAAEAPYLRRQHEALRALTTAPDGASRGLLARQADAAYRESTPHLSPGDYEFVAAQVGASDPHEDTLVGTAWCVHVPSPRFETWMRMQAELVRNPSFRGFTGAAAHTAEILRFQYEGAGAMLDMERMFAETYGQTLDVDAEFETIASLPLDAAMAFHDTLYRPNNLAIVLVGDITPERAVPVVEAAFGDWEPAALPASPLMTDAPWGGRRFIERTSPGGEQVLVGWSLPPTNDGSRALVEALASMLTGTDGILSTILHENDKVIDGDLILLDRGLVVTASPADGVSMDEVEAELVNVMKRVAAGEIDDALWARVQARQELDAVMWSRSVEGLAMTISDAYLHHRAWPEVAASLSPREIDRAQLSGLATRLLQRGVAVVHARPGEPWSPPIDPLPFGPPPKKTGVHSPYADEIVSLPASDLEPRYLGEGMHFERTAWGSGQVITAPTKGPLFRVSLAYPRGVVDDPLVCDAARFRSIVWSKGGTNLPGADAWVECGAHDTTVHVLGISDRFETTWDALWKGIRDDHVDPRAWRRERDFVLHYREEARLDPIAFSDAMHTFAVRGATSIDRNMQSDAELAHASAAEVSTSLHDLVALTPDVLYAGPEPERVRPRLPEPMAPAPSREPERTPASPTTTIYLHDVPGVDQADFRVSVMWREDSTPDALLLELYLVHPPPAVDAVMAAGGMAYDPLAPPELDPWRPDHAGWGYHVAHDRAQESLAAVLDALGTGPDPTSFGHAVGRLQNRYRIQRVGAIDIPRFVRSWGDRTTDPRIDRWSALGRLRPEAFAAFAEQLAEQPVVITLVADLSRLDVDQLQLLARVVRPEPADVLRDIALTDAGMGAPM